jgi:tetratricopeptide (TPR) repeat protein
MGTRPRYIVLAVFTSLAIAAGADRVADLQRAAALIDARDLAGAEAVLASLLDQSSQDPLALNLMGIVRMREGQSATAEILFRDAIEHAPMLPGPHINLATLYAEARPSAAIAELREALKLAPANTEAAALLRSVGERSALAAVRAGNKEAAVALMLDARNALPHDPEMLYKFGLVATEAGLYADAKEAEEEALRIRPDFVEAMYALARAMISGGKGQQAEPWLRKYLALRANDATAQYGLGYLLVAEQRLDEARGCFERSLALQPDQTESQFQLGVVALKQGDTAAANEWFSKVLARDNNHAGALTEVAVLALHDLRYQESADLLHRAVNSSPSYQKAHYYLGVALGKLGRKEESDREFAIATELKKSPVIVRLAITPTEPRP